jgi:hypothetical protein
VSQNWIRAKNGSQSGVDCYPLSNATILLPESSCGLPHITASNRDSDHVTFQHCPVDKCDEIESKLFDKYVGVESMPCAQRRPHKNNNT